MHKRKVVFLVLTAFSATGGIEKFNRAFLKALNELHNSENLSISAASMYDNKGDTNFIETNKFRTYSGNRFRFVVDNFFRSFKEDEMILGHINLAVIGVLYKWMFPHKSVTLICHGIEVFEPVGGLKKKILFLADRILAVSHFTKQQIETVQGINPNKINIFPNTIDPHFKLPKDFSKPGYLQKRYKVQSEEKIIFTLTRLQSNEGYKGYPMIINLLPKLINKGVNVKYILAGKADDEQKKYLQQLINDLGLNECVIMPGFIADEEVTDHYLLADVFVMPSKGEGFGIVFLEAMACGLPVIAGNKDGSTEALQFGELGTLVDPDNENDIEQAIVNVFGTEPQPYEIQQQMLNFFSFEAFVNRLAQHFSKPNLRVVRA